MLRRTSPVIHTSGVGLSFVTSETTSMLVTCLEIQPVKYALLIITETGCSTPFQKMVYDLKRFFPDS